MRRSGGAEPSRAVSFPSLVSGKREAHARRAVEVAHRDSPNPNPRKCRTRGCFGTRLEHPRVRRISAKTFFSAPAAVPLHQISARGVAPGPAPATMRPRTSRASRGYAPPLLALLALLALTRAPSASADVAGAPPGRSALPRRAGRRARGFCAWATRARPLASRRLPASPSRSRRRWRCAASRGSRSRTRRSITSPWRFSTTRDRPSRGTSASCGSRTAAPSAPDADPGGRGNETSRSST